MCIRIVGLRVKGATGDVSFRASLFLKRRSSFRGATRTFRGGEVFEFTALAVTAEREDMPIRADCERATMDE